MTTVLLIIHLFVTLALIGVVLIQRSEGGGLGIGTSQGMGGFMSGRGNGEPADADDGDSGDDLLHPFAGFGFAEPRDGWGWAVVVGQPAAGERACIWRGGARVAGGAGCRPRALRSRRTRVSVTAFPLASPMLYRGRP